MKDTNEMYEKQNFRSLRHVLMETEKNYEFSP